MRAMKASCALSVLIAGLALTADAPAEVVNVETEYYPSLGKIKLDIATPRRKPTGGYRSPAPPTWQPLWLGKNRFTAPDGQTGLRATYYKNPNLEGEPAAARVEPFATLDQSFLRAHAGKKNHSIRWRGTYGPAPAGGVYLLKIVTAGGVRAHLNGEKVIDAWSGGGMRSHTARVQLKKGQTVDFRLDYRRKKGKQAFRAAWARLADGEKNGGATPLVFELIDEKGEAVHSEQIAFNYSESGQRVLVDVGDVKAGSYTASLRAKGSDRRATRQLHREYYVWEGNRLGITDKVYPPFEPVETDGKNVSVVMREYEHRGLGLWKSIKARGNGRNDQMRELLAGPAALRVNGGQRIGGDGKIAEAGKQRVIYQGSASHPAVNVQTRCTTHYDGVMKVELTLKPGAKNEQLDKLWLDIPVRDAAAPLFHATMIGNIRDNPAGAVPSGDGVVWDARDLKAPHYYGNFHPYVWVGAEERGLCWFADNDKGWVLDVNDDEPQKSVPCQQLIRRDGKLILRVNLVQKPVKLERARKITFGLMATPGKPMPDGWRNVFFRNRPSEDARTIHWMAAQYWGSPTIMYSKLPEEQDTSVLSKLQERRLGGGGWKPFMRAWKQKYLSDGTDGGKSAKKIAGLLNHAGRISRHAGGYLTAYWEEFHATTLGHPERQVFGDEWMDSTHSYPESYLNFACWAGAEFIRRGIGLYFDNCFPKPTYDRLTTAAYQLPNGRIQPSANMWRQRRYLRRIWVLHQQLAPAATKPLMMLHMTNSNIPPYMIYGMSNLDLEWRYGKGTAQSKYAPDLLRAESTGLHAGNIPTSLAKGGHRTRFGAMMVHEIRAEHFKASGQKMLRSMAQFGYTKPEAEVYNYWEENAPLSVSDARCKWLLTKHHGELMVLLCTWNKEKNKVRVRIDADALGVNVSKAINAETDEAQKLKGGKFSVSMPGHGVRLFHIK